MTNAIQNRIVFSGESGRNAYRLNKFLVSMRDAGMRDAFDRDPERAMSEFGLSEQERDLVRRRDYQAMLDYGVVIYALGKAAAGLKTTLLAMGAQMKGQPVEAVAEWIAAGKNAEG